MAKITVIHGLSIICALMCAVGCQSKGASFQELRSKATTVSAGDSLDAVLKLMGSPSNRMSDAHGNVTLIYYGSSFDEQIILYFKASNGFDYGGIVDARGKTDLPIARKQSDQG